MVEQRVIFVTPTALRQLMLRSRILFIILFASVYFGVSSCKDHKQMNNSGDEFEGVITYHELSINNEHPELNADDTVRLYYSHGDYVNVHSGNSSKFRVLKDFYLKEKPLRLFLYNNSDSLSQLKLSLPIQRLDSFKIEKTKDRVLSKDCEKVNLSISYHDPDSITYTNINYTFSRGFIKVDKDNFKDWTLGYFNKIIAETSCFYLNFKTVHFDSSHKKILSVKSYNVISVKQEPVDRKMFDIDLSLIKTSNGAN